MKAIPSYIINLKKREDRKNHALLEFSSRKEFEVSIVDACEHQDGAYGLWITLSRIIGMQKNKDDNFILICEDDHCFTGEYSTEKLRNAIEHADALGADLLCGGVSWLSNGVMISSEILWVERFSGLQFTIVFRRFFETILNTAFNKGEAADTKLSFLTSKKYCIFPFISIQKYFGYSDVTDWNNRDGRVEQLFANSLKKAGAIKYVTDHYNRIKQTGGQLQTIAPNAEALPVIVFEKPSDAITAGHLPFHRDNGFNVMSVIPADSSEHSKLTNLQEVIKKVTLQGGNMIILWQNDHFLQQNYSISRLKNILTSAQELGTEILCGSLDDFDLAVPINNNLLWISSFKEAGLLVIYKNLFDKINNLAIEGNSTMESLLSRSAVNKISVHPFIVSSAKKQYLKAEVYLTEFSKYRDPDSRIELAKQAHYLGESIPHRAKTPLTHKL